MRVTIAILLVALLTGCASRSPRPAGVAPAIRLSATLVSPTDITLRWTDREQGIAGHIVEFATAPNGKYTNLQFLPPRQTTYTHPDLIPQTPFYYRVRPYLGPVSRSIEITLPKPDAKAAKKDQYRWAPPKVVRGKPVATHSVRTDAAAAAPADLKATAMHADGIKFTWTDHASDEEGYLLEAKPKGSTDFAVVAVLDPNVDAFGLITLPSEKTAEYRLRAYYYGTSSNLAHQTTGAGSPD
jgi:hypothetical protein